jgi:hypothetical protein
LRLQIEERASSGELFEVLPMPPLPLVLPPEPVIVPSQLLVKGFDYQHRLRFQPQT